MNAFAELAYQNGFDAAHRNALEHGRAWVLRLANGMIEDGVMRDPVLVWYHGYVAGAAALPRLTRRTIRQ